jgi:nicotinamide-nucleotide amidase
VMIRDAVTLSVGDELLAGETLDTHGRTIAASLSARGCRVLQHRVLGDDVSNIAAAIVAGTADADLVVITGGLGPTLDDVSREALAEAMNESLVEDPASRAHLDQWYAGRGRVMPVGNVRQALRPASATCIENPNGTAPGLRARLGAALVVILPGPPREMRPMLEGVLERTMACLSPEWRGRMVVRRTNRLARCGSRSPTRRVSMPAASVSPVTGRWCVIEPRTPRCN